MEVWCGRRVSVHQRTHVQVCGSRHQECAVVAARRWVKVGERLGERLDRAGRDHISVTVRCLTLYVWGIVARRTRRAGERVRVRDGELETCDWKVESRSEE